MRNSSTVQLLRFYANFWHHMSADSLNLHGFMSSHRGVTGGWAEWAIAHPIFGRIEGAAG